MSEIKATTRETLKVGDTGTFSKQITEGDVFHFSDTSGDYNPLHIDDEYAKRTILGERVTHGIVTAAIISTVVGGELPGLGTVFVELHIRFIKPVYLGDTITATAMVMEIVNPKRVRLMIDCHNQKGNEVAVGNAVVVPPKDTRLIQ